MKSISSFAIQSPVADQRYVFTGCTFENLVLDNDDANTCRTNILLGSCVYNIVFRPFDLFAAEVAAHITYYELALRNYVPREICEFKTLDGFIIAVMEESSVLFDIPLFSWFYKRVFVFHIGGYLMWLAVFSSFLNSPFRPGTSS
jgi:hypothetical protein